jgi:hypothetical protein
LAPTVGIAATGFCYPGGILQLFHWRYQQIFSTSSRSTAHTTEDSWSKDMEQYEEIKIGKFFDCRQQQPDRIVSSSHTPSAGELAESASTWRDQELQRQDKDQQVISDTSLIRSDDFPA